MGSRSSVYYFVEWEHGDIICKNYDNIDDYFQKYEYEKSIFSPEGVDRDLVNSTPDGVYMECINRHFVVVTYKYDRMHYNRLFKHLADQLLYLNPATLKVDVLYQSKAQEIIIYGTLEHVILYNAEAGVYRYISLEDNTVISEVSSNINPFQGDYWFDALEEDGVFMVYRYPPAAFSFFSEHILVDSLPLSPE